METVRCEAIVLKLADYRESDRLVTLFTLEHGRLSGIARGARRSVRRFGGALELFARLQLQMKVRHALSDLLEADIVTIHHGIRGDLYRIAHAGYACELLIALAPEGQANPRLFRLISAYLAHLDANPATPDDRRFFEINLLNILGYRPSLDACSRCGSALGDKSAGACHIAGGEVVCRACAPVGQLLSFETLGLLSRCLRTGRVGAVEFPPLALSEAGRFLDAAIASHVTVTLRSLAFLQELEPTLTI